MTLLTACQNALKEMGKWDPPSTIVSNTDPTAYQLLALANRAGRALAKMNWQVLLSTHSFSTAASTASYALPDDFDRFSNLTAWNGSNYWHIKGPVTAMEWQVRQSSSIASPSGMNTAFRIAGSLFYIDPTPTAIETVTYQYYSNEWIANDKTAFTADADTVLFPEDLLVLGIRWRFLAAKGDSFENEKAEYQEQLDLALARDGGRDAIRFSDATRPRELGGNLPDTGYGL